MSAPAIGFAVTPQRGLHRILIDEIEGYTRRTPRKRKRVRDLRRSK
jgi:hypothetical protein